METGKINYNKIGYALAELPRKIQIKIVISCLKDKTLDYIETYYTYCFLIFKSSLRSKDRCYIYNLQNRLLKPKLKKYYLERCKCSHFKLMKMLRSGYYPPVVLDNVAKHNGSERNGRMKNCYFKPTKTGFEYTGELDECIKEAEIDLFNLKINAKLCLGRTAKEKERLKKILETIEIYRRFILIGKKHIEREKKEKKANGKEL